MIVVEPRRRGPPSPQEADPRRIEHHSLAVSIGKKHAPRRESIDVWGLQSRVNTKTADPDVEVIKRDKKDIGFVCFGERRGHSERR